VSKHLQSLTLSLGNQIRLRALIGQCEVVEVEARLPWLAYELVCEVAHGTLALPPATLLLVVGAVERWEARGAVLDA
jgi:hypothetical protein